MWEHLQEIITVFKLLFGSGVFIWTVNMLNNTKLAKVNREFGAFLIVCAFFIVGMLNSQFFLIGFGVFTGIQTFQKVKNGGKIPTSKE